MLTDTPGQGEGSAFFKFQSVTTRDTYCHSCSIDVLLHRQTESYADNQITTPIANAGAKRGNTPIREAARMEGPGDTAEQERWSRGVPRDGPGMPFPSMANPMHRLFNQWDKNAEIGMNGSDLRCINTIIGTVIRKSAGSALSDRNPDTEKHATAVPAKRRLRERTRGVE